MYELVSLDEILKRRSYTRDIYYSLWCYNRVCNRTDDDYKAEKLRWQADINIVKLIHEILVHIRDGEPVSTWNYTNRRPIDVKWLQNNEKFTSMRNHAGTEPESHRHFT